MKLRKLSIFMFLALLIGCVPSAKQKEPGSVIRAFFDALNKGQTTVATDYFASDGQIITGAGQPKGKDKVAAYLIGRFKQKEHTDIMELTVNGSFVAGTLNVTNTTLESIYGKGKIPLMSLKAEVEDGKIVTLEIGTAAGAN